MAALLAWGQGASAQTTVQWATDASGFWDEPSNWSGGAAPQAGDSVVINRAGATPTITIRTTTAAIASLDAREPLVITGTLTVTGTATFRADVSWPSGTLAGPGTFVVAAGATLTQINTVALSTPLTNHGTVTASGGIYTYGVAITNAAGATWEAAGGWGIGNQSGTSTFSNAGTLRKSGGGTLALSGVALTNAGTLELAGGTVSVSSASNTGVLSVAAGQTLQLANFTLGAGTTFAGSGALHVSGTLVVTAPLTITRPLTFDGGEIAGAGAVTFAAPTTWSGGTLAAVAGATVAAGATLTQINTVALSTPLTNHGTVTASGGIYTYGAAITNAAGATWEATGGWGIGNQSGTSTFTNLGTFRGTGSLGTWAIGVPVVNAGLIQLRVGGTTSGQYDRLAASTATLGGLLWVVRANGFVPTVGSTYDAVSYTTRSGEFAAVEGGADAYSAAYGASALTLTVAQPPAERTLTLVGAGSGAGSVTSQAGLTPAIACTVAPPMSTGACRQAYPTSGTTVTLTATATPGATFTGWLNCPAPSGNTCTIVMTSSHAVGVAFSASPPAVTSLAPASGPIGGGTAVAIVGSNFLNGATAVTFNGVPAVAVTVTTTSALTAVAPPGVAGTAPVVVRTPAGSADSATVFSYVTGCEYSVVPTGSDRVAAGGGSFSVAITTAGACTWAASSLSPWITASGPAFGTGNGSVAFVAAPNGGQVRAGTVNVAGEVIPVGQLGPTVETLWTTVSADSSGPYDISTAYMSADGTTITYRKSGALWVYDVRTKQASSLGQTGFPTAISVDGRYIAYGTPNAHGHWATAYYVYDRATGLSDKVSVSSTGVDTGIGQNPGLGASMSGDGRFVVMQTGTRLTANAVNSPTNIYLRDRVARTTTLLTTDAQGAGVPGGHGNAVISSDGRHVVFTSDVAWVPEDTNGVVDVYAREIATGVMTLVSRELDGSVSARPSTVSAISATGRVVTFLRVSAITGQQQVFAHDRDTDADGVLDEPGAVTTFLVSVLPNGTALTDGSVGGLVSGSGRHLVFINANVPYLYDRDPDEDGLFDAPSRVQAILGGSFWSPASLAGDGRRLTLVVWPSTVVVADSTDPLPPPPPPLAVVPSSGPTAGATSVVLMGSNFREGAVVTVGGTPATNVALIDENHLSLVIPQGVAGPATVSVRNAGGARGSLTGAFTYVPPPSVTSVTPSTGPTDGNTPVTITGNGILQGAVVRFGGVVATGVVVESPTRILARTPAGVPGGAAVTVTNPDGQAAHLSSAYSFVFVAPPLIASVSPVTGAPVGGFPITITGSNLGGAAEVRVGGLPAAVTAAGPGAITVTAPSHAAGIVDVEVRKVNGQRAVAAEAFEYTRTQPFVLSISTAGAVANAELGQPASISDDGRYAVFGSPANNLVEGDTNEALDVFVHDHRKGETRLVSSYADGTQFLNGGETGGSGWNVSGGTHLPVISGDGRWVVFLSESIVVGPTQGGLFAKDLVTGDVRRLGRSPDGTKVVPYWDRYLPAVSRDGRYVAFATEVSMVGSDAGGLDIYVEDRDADGDGIFDEPGHVQTTLVSRTPGGAAARSVGTTFTISRDGQHVVFTSEAASLVAGDTNGVADVFVWSRATNLVRRVSVTSAGGQLPGGSAPSVSVSETGRFVAFISLNTNFGAPASSSAWQAYVHDRDTDEDGVFDEPGTTSTEQMPSPDFLIALQNTSAMLSAVPDCQISPQTRPDCVFSAAVAEVSLSRDGRYLTFTYPVRLWDLSGGAFGFIPRFRHYFGTYDRVARRHVRENLTSTGAAFSGSSLSTSGDGSARAFSSNDTQVIPGGSSAPFCRGSGTQCSQYFGIDRRAPDSGAAPEISSVSPAAGTTFGGTSVSVRGSGFVAGALVLFGGVSAGSVSFVDATHLVAQTPARPAGAVAVTVVNPDGGTAVRQDAFTYLSPCQYGVSPLSTTVDATGGTIAIAVTTSAGCTWNAVSETPWIIRTSGSSPSGAGAATFSVSANTGAARDGTVTVAGRLVSVVQLGACSVTLDPPVAELFASSGSGSVRVKTSSSGCAWSASADVGWLTLAITSGVGDATVGYTFTGNAGSSPRGGSITVGNQVHAVTQRPTSCTFVVLPTTHPVSASGGAVTIQVSTGAACPWTLAGLDESATWIRPRPPGAGVGAGTVTLDIDANEGPARVAEFTVAGDRVVVSQSAGNGPACSYTLAVSAPMPVTGGVAQLTIGTPDPSCPWALPQPPNWLSTADALSGQGPRTLTFSTGSNVGGRPREMVVALGGRTAYVGQLGEDCAITDIKPYGFTGPVDTGGEKQVMVFAPRFCMWTMTSGANWARPTASHTVLNPGAASHSDLVWLPRSPGVGGVVKGFGTANVFVEVDPPPSDPFGRLGWLAVDAGVPPVRREVPIEQPGAFSLWSTGWNLNCRTEITPEGVLAADHPNAGGGRQAGVYHACWRVLIPSLTVQPFTYQWTNTTDVSWIDITQGVAGPSSPFAYTVKSNPGGQCRRGRVMVAGQRFNVTQGCTVPPPPPPTVEVVGVELTQGIQSTEPEYRIPLVKGRDTRLRVYLRSTEPATVDYAVTLYDPDNPGNTLALPPESHTAYPVVSRETAISRDEVVFPRHWAKVAVRVELPSHPSACGVGTDETRHCSAVYDILPGRPLSVRVVRVEWTDEVGKVYQAPAQSTVEDAQRQLLQLLPVDDLQFADEATAAAIDWRTSECVPWVDTYLRDKLGRPLRSVLEPDYSNLNDVSSDVLMVLNCELGLRYQLVATERDEYVLGLVSGLPGYSGGQAGAIAGKVTGSPSGAYASRIASLDVPDRSLTAAHELGHLLGRMHVKSPADGLTNVDGFFPAGWSGHVTPAPWIPLNDCESGARYRGFALGSALASASPICDAFDLMSYGSPNWISAYTYLGIWAGLLWDDERNALLSLPTDAVDLRSLILSGPAGRSGAPITKALRSQSSMAGPVRGLAGPSSGLGTSVLSVSALLSASSNSAAFLTVAPGANPSPEGVSGYHLAALDVGGSEVGRVELPKVLGVVEGGGGSDVALITVGLSTAGTVRTLQITDPGGNVIATRTGTPNPPLVTITSGPPASINAGADVPIAWQASDFDGGTLYRYVQLSVDGGTTWEPVAVPVGDSVVLSTTQWPNADAAQLRLVVSDGFNFTVAETAPFAIVGQTPVVYVIAPAQGGSYPSNGPVYLSGHGFSPQGTPLSDGALEWLVDGVPVGTGRSLSVPLQPFDPGTHVVTLRGTAEGLAAEVTRTIFVAPPAMVRAPRLVPGVLQLNVGFGTGTQGWTRTAELEDVDPGESIIVGAPWVQATRLAGGRTLQLVANTAALPVGQHEAVVWLVRGNGSWRQLGSLRATIVPCTYSLTATRLHFGMSGGSAVLRLSAPEGCAATLSTGTLPLWLSINAMPGTAAAWAVTVTPATTPRGYQIVVGPQAVQIVQDPDGTADLDRDGLPDAWETYWGLSGTSPSQDSGPDGDPDGDGFTNAQELSNGTHPRGLFSRFFAEGASSGFFSLNVALVNPRAEPASVLLRFLKSDGTVVAHALTMPPASRRTITAGAIAGLESAEFSTVVESDVEIVADRTMSWDVRGYGAHAETSTRSPALTWYLAEGATHSNFDLFYLIQNPDLTRPARVRARYLLPSGQPLERLYDVAPNSRFNIWADMEEFPAGSGNRALGNTDVSAVFQVENNVPVIVERAMYLSQPGLYFQAGHESAGITAPATKWFLAEGATGPYFDLFVLVANPTPTVAQIRATYLLPDGRTYQKDYTVAPNARFNIWVDLEDIPGSGRALADTAVSTTIESMNGVPIIVERAMWWPGDWTTWHEAHNSAGATTTGTTWALAEGEVDSTRNLETYILVANTSSTPADVKVTLLFEDGTRAEQTYPSIPARSRFNVPVGGFFPQAAGRRFGALVESLGSAPAQIVVERAMYWDAAGQFWAAGTNALATRLK